MPGDDKVKAILTHQQIKELEALRLTVFYNDPASPVISKVEIFSDYFGSYLDITEVSLPQELQRNNLLELVRRHFASKCSPETAS